MVFGGVFRNIMNWYKTIKIGMPLSPNAWEMYDPSQNHTLLKDKPIQKTPWGHSVVNPMRPKQELQQDYQGVHATESLDLAALYANNFSTPQDPPVVLAFTTTQHWNPDIDTTVDYSLEVVIDAIKENMKGMIPASLNKKYNQKTVTRIMNNIKDIDTFMWGAEEEHGQDLYEDVQKQVIRDLPDNVIDFFKTYYQNNSPQVFYNKFILPVFFNKGVVDPLLHAYIINQVRFMEPIQDDQIVSVYYVEPFTHDYVEEPEDDDEDENEDEEDEYGGRYKVTLENSDGNFSPSPRLMWQNPQIDLFELPIFYHGTLLSRAKQAIPGLNRVFDQIMLFHTGNQRNA